ncbi:cutinase family protein [Rhodococcus jostii]|uniref:Cutinase family protein n=1 Tax=Rhodococcus jostii TaxID=132919 RepID=A0ABU4CRT0_RHOJO|nr:cutinase family protein [Rhodococcus jostii]MDV6285802.1 cutinase family protein [Rhodococcus jostii]
MSTPIAVAQPTTCANDVQFVGAPGSGENPAMNGVLGPTVEGLFTATKSVVEKAGRTVGLTPINYPAEDVSILTSDVPRYFRGLSDGVELTMRSLDQLVTDPSCSDVRIVLGGYSQGAMVMHRVLRRLEDTRYDSLRNRIDAAVLIADGDKVTNDRVKAFGSAGNGSHGLGVDFPAISGSSATKLSSKWGSRVKSICNSGDALCAYGSVLAPVQLPVFLAGNGVSTHKSYVHGGMPEIVAALKSVKFTFPSDKPIFTSTTDYFMQTYTESRTTLNARAGRGCTVEWSAARGLPPGLLLSKEGALIGIPTEIGKFKFSVTMESMCSYPRKQVAARASITVTVSPGVPPPDPSRISYEVTVGTNYNSGECMNCDPNYRGYVVAGADQLKSLGFRIVDDGRVFTGTANKPGHADWAVGHKDASGRPIIDPTTGQPSVQLFRLIAVQR